MPCLYIDTCIIYKTNIYKSKIIIYFIIMFNEAWPASKVAKPHSLYKYTQRYTYT